MSDHFLFGLATKPAIAVRQFGGERLEDLLFGEVHVRRAAGMGDRQAVIADQGFGDVGHAVVGAELRLRIP